MGFDTADSQRQSSGQSDASPFAVADARDHNAASAHTKPQDKSSGDHSSLAKNGFPKLHIETEENLPNNDPRPHRGSERVANPANSKGPKPTEVTELTDLEADKNAGKLYGLHGMQFRASDQNKLDALVYVPKGFDASKPANVVVHVHGWWKDLKECWQYYQIGDQVKNIDPQTLVVMPAWQQLNGNGGKAGSSSQGSLLKPGSYSKMLQESFDKTPGVGGLQLENADQITVVAHSAGYVPTARLIQDLGNKITTLAALDTPRSGAVDNWVKQHKSELQKGEKQYFDIYNTYRDGGNAQLKDVWGAKPPSVTMCSDAARMTVSNHDESTADLSKCSIVYIDSPTTHFIIPQKYLGTVIDLSNQLKDKH